MAQSELPDFPGKVAYIQLPVEGQSWLLVEPELERQCGSWVLVGKPLTGDENFWAYRATIGIPWKYVVYYVVFDTVEQAQAWRRAKPTTPEAAKPARRGWLGRGRGP